MSEAELASLAERIETVTYHLGEETAQLRHEVSLLKRRTCPDPEMLWGKEEIEEFTGFAASTVNKLVARKDFPRKAPHVLHRWRGQDVIKYFNQR